MRTHKIALAAAIALTAVAANAAPNVITSGPLTGMAIELAEGGNVTGGTVNIDGTADGGSIPGVRTEPSLTTPGTAWLAAGSTFGTATLDLSGYDTSAVSFDWGTPGFTDVLTVNESNGVSTTSSTFTALDAGFGSQVQSGPGGYVTVTADAGYTLAGLSFANSYYAFEVSNFTAAAPAVPEPANVALMLGGLAMLGFMLRKRRI